MTLNQFKERFEDELMSDWLASDREMSFDLFAYTMYQNREEEGM